MLYDRDYMQSSKELLKRSFCDQLIFLLIICFLVQAITALLFDLDKVNEIVAFGISALSSGYIWSIISYGLLHDGPFHLIVNLLGIHFICRYIEEYLGRTKFIYFCIFSIIAGGIAWLPFNTNPQQYLVGASALVLSSLCIFCLLQPNKPITLLLFFILPVTLKPKWILLGTLGLELYGFFSTELTGYGGIAHSAHLGGMLCGFIYFLYAENKFSLPIRFTLGSNFKVNKNNDSKKNFQVPKSNFRVNFSTNDSIQAETDRILDKINDLGFGSLTDAEKETLEKAKKLLGK